MAEVLLCLHCFVILPISFLFLTILLLHISLLLIFLEKNQ